MDEPVAQCSEIIMSSGNSHVTHQYPCLLCGMKNGAKVDCAYTEGPKDKCNSKFHVTCARQAGFEINEDMKCHCFWHVDPSSVFRARLEDFLEIELCRYSDKSLRTSATMTWEHATKLFHGAVVILRTLGWAWRWAEWWVDLGDNWEPLLEDGQVEANMTSEELKKVDSTKESRSMDARRCRLAAFGAALRNRDFDKEEGDDRAPLERALKAIFSTPSLVGPLKSKEIDIYVTWVALAYRSNSPLLGFGANKTPVASEGECLHTADGSPKYELGTRPLPGKNAPLKGVFEPSVDEVDDFLKYPIATTHIKRPSKKKKRDKPKGCNNQDKKSEVVEKPLDTYFAKKKVTYSDETSEEEFTL